MYGTVFGLPLDAFPSRRARKHPAKESRVALKEVSVSSEEVLFTFLVICHLE